MDFGRRGICKNRITLKSDYGRAMRCDRFSLWTRSGTASNRSRQTIVVLPLVTNGQKND